MSCLSNICYINQYFLDFFLCFHLCFLFLQDARTLFRREDFPSYMSYTRFDARLINNVKILTCYHLKQIE